MNAETEKILALALQLPQEARAALAGSLISSLDETVDEDAEAVWAAEITRRVEELNAGRAQTIPWADVRRGLQSR